MPSETSGDSGFEVKFGGAAGAKLPGSKALHRLAETRTRRNETLKKFASTAMPSSKAAAGLVDALIDYDKVRYGRMWQPADADRLAKIYRKAIGAGDLSTLNPAALGKRTISMRKIPKTKTRKLGDGPFVPYDSPAGGIVDPATTGWYYEKHFDYSGGWCVLLTFERFNQPTIGADISCTLRDPGPDGHTAANAETGRWFDFTPTKTGYPNVICFFDTQYATIQRHTFPNEAPGAISTVQTIDAGVGLLSGDDFIGRQYIQLHQGSYGGDGIQGTANVNDKSMPSGGFIMNGASRIEAGEKVQVLFGIRTKVIAAMKECGASLATAHRAYPTALGCGIVETNDVTQQPW